MLWRKKELWNSFFYEICSITRCAETGFAPLANGVMVNAVGLDDGLFNVNSNYPASLTGTLKILDKYLFLIN